MRLKDLPAEMISMIDQNLAYEDRKKFREVGLGCALLRHSYTDNIQKSSIIKLDLYDDIDACIKFINHYQFIINSRMEISLDLPSSYELSKVNQLETAIINLVNICSDRICQISVMNTVPKHLVELILPKCIKLEKIRINTDESDSQIFLKLINTNSPSLTHLQVEGINFHQFQFNDLPKLSEIKVIFCSGKRGLQSLLTKSAPTLSRLELYLEEYGDSDMYVGAPLSMLKVLILSEWDYDYNHFLCNQIDVRSSDLLTRSGNLSEVATYIKKTYYIQN